MHIIDDALTLRREYYGISDDFSYKNLVCHSQKDRPNKVSLISTEMSDILRNNLRLKVLPTIPDSNS